MKAFSVHMFITEKTKKKCIINVTFKVFLVISFYAPIREVKEVRMLTACEGYVLR